MKPATYTCNLCHKVKPKLGGGLRFINGLRCWVCITCKEKKK